ncbi:hypothetical protein PsorP6_004907 [Peronosclerospora sorghi]|uniref:Uncharacterized protein n=1 Tax=Peronosclerospora sorghi TaxID=230839 RepID=A0ACC0W2M0_9STRA|nr:hypothetical protein PsorP6_004907 [Peronosclerospora sorghi]
MRNYDGPIAPSFTHLTVITCQGDYYGLGKRPSPSTRHVKKKCAKVKSRRTSSAFGPRSFGQQFSPFRRRRAIPPVSYVEPKINTKLRQVRLAPTSSEDTLIDINLREQGDKFTFTT